MKHNVTKVKGQVVIQAPWIDPPLNCRWFDEIADLSIDPGQTITLISFEIPIASEGIIKWFGQAVCSPGSSNDFVWKIKINNGPDETYGSITGLISTIQDPTETFILLKRASKIELTVTNNGALACNVIGRLKGWYWAEYD